MDDYKYIILLLGSIILFVYKYFNFKNKDITIFSENISVYYKNREIYLQKTISNLEFLLKNEKDKNHKLIEYTKNQKEINKKLLKIINNMLRIYT